LFNIAQDERERANLSGRESARFETMRQHYLSWDATVPPIPEDAVVSLVYGTKNMPER